MPNGPRPRAPQSAVSFADCEAVCIAFALNSWPVACILTNTTKRNSTVTARLQPPREVTPDVTIVMPVGADAGGLPGVRRSLESIGADPLAEVVVVLHDGAPAGIAAWLAVRAAADPRLLVIGEERSESDDAQPDARHDGAGGLAWARNLGIAAASAPLVAFLDAGDAWVSGRLGAHRALHAGHPAIGFTFTDCRRFGTEGGHGSSALASWSRFAARHGSCRTPFLLGADALAQLFSEQVVVTSTVVARTDLLRELGGFATDLAAPAWDLWLRLAARAPVACLPEASVDTWSGAATREGSASPLAAGEIAARHRLAARCQDTGAVRVLAMRLAERAFGPVPQVHRALLGMLRSRPAGPSRAA